MLPTVVGVLPFVATGQSTTTAPAGRFPPPFAKRTWFTFTPPGKTFKGRLATVAVGVFVVEIAPKEPAIDAPSPVLSIRGLSRSAGAIGRIPLLSGCKIGETRRSGNFNMTINYKRKI